MGDDVGILLFGHTRPMHIIDVLESLKRQGVVGNVDVWLDGHQDAPEVKYRTELVREAVNRYRVGSVTSHNGALGFRKLMLHALDDAASRYRYIIVLEDDCFPVRDAISVFVDELKKIESEQDVFSVYGHPFLVPAEGETCTRFQGWGWATTGDKLKQHIRKLIYLYSVTEEQYLAFVDKALTPEIVSRLDVTPGRQPTDTLRRFFAWDEVLAMLTALAGQVHRKTPERAIYNFGASGESSRFKDVRWYLEPPFNMVEHKDLWNYF